MISQKYKTQNGFDEKHELLFEELINFYEANTIQTISKLEDVFSYYNFSNKEKISSESGEIPELKFVFGAGEFSLIILLVYKNGVADTHFDYGKIVENAELKNPFPEFKTEDEESAFLELFIDYESAIFFVWFSWLWQEKKFSNCGLKVNISDYQCSLFFYLNDFAWKKKSEVISENIYPIKTFLTGKLTPFEIFRRFKSENHF